MSVFNSREELISAVAEWTANATNASSVHGHISSWDTSNVTDMHAVFSGALWLDGATVANQQFNDDINAWDVGQVTNMRDMFARAFSFDQELNDWNVSQVTDMTNMFWVHSAPPSAGRLSPLRAVHVPIAPRIGGLPRRHDSRAAGSV